MKSVIFDLSAVAGIACLTYAGYQLHPALAWLVGGSALAYFGIAGAAIARRQKGSKG